MSKGLSVGVVGCGIGGHHVRAYQSLSDRFKVLAICDIDGARAHELAAEHNVPRVSSDLAELCQWDELDEGERACFYVVFEGGTIHLFDDDGLLVAKLDVARE